MKNISKNIAAVFFGIFLAVVLLLIFDYCLELFVSNNYRPKYLPPPVRRSYTNPPAQDGLRVLSDSKQWRDFRVPEVPVSLAGSSPMDLNLKIHPFVKKINNSYAIYPKNHSFNETATLQGSITIFNANYSTDSHSRRNTVPSAKASQVQVLFMGDSNTWGTAVNDPETYPSYFQAMNPSLRVYNLGIPGGSVNDFIDDVSKNYFRYDDILPKRGFTIYAATTDHIERSSCTLRCFNKSYRRFVPQKYNFHYDEENDTLENLGSFLESRLILNTVYILLNKLFLIEYFGINLPPFITNHQIKRFVRMVDELRKISEQKFGTKFYFTMYPGRFHNFSILIPELEKRGISYLDYSAFNFGLATRNRNVLPIDTHPTSLSHFLFAKLLTDDLSAIAEKTDEKLSE